MPLSSFALTLNNTFAFETAVANWAALTQGENQVTFGLGTLDVADWDEAFADVLPIASAGDADIDLYAFTNLAGESTGLRHALAIVVKVEPAVAGDTDFTVSVSPGASNGLQWLTPTGEALKLRAGESFALAGDPAGSGVTVNATNRTLNFANGGPDAARVTVTVLGSTS